MMAFRTKAGNVNLKETEQMAPAGQLNAAPAPAAQEFMDFNDQDDMFNTSNKNDADIRSSQVSDSGSESEREGGWQTAEFLQKNVASSDGDISMNSKRYGRSSRSSSEIDEPAATGGGPFNNMIDDEFGGSMDSSYTGLPPGRRNSSIGVGRDGTPLGGSSATGLDDSMVGMQIQRRQSLEAGGDGGDGGGGGGGGGDFGHDDFGDDNYTGENDNNYGVDDFDYGQGGGAAGGLGDLSFGDDGEQGTPSKKLRLSLDGGDGGIQWDLLDQGGKV